MAHNFDWRDVHTLGRTEHFDLWNELNCEPEAQSVGVLLRLSRPAPRSRSNCFLSVVLDPDDVRFATYQVMNERPKTTTVFAATQAARLPFAQMVQSSLS